MVTEVDYTKQIKRIIVEMVAPLDRLDRADILLQTMYDIPDEKKLKILEMLGYKVKEEEGE